MVRLKPEESKKLAVHVSEAIASDKSVKIKIPRPQLTSTIENVLSHHFEIERQIELKADQLYQEQVGEMGGLEKGKALGMIRRQLADEKKFVLSGGNEGRFSQDKLNVMAHLIDDKLYDDDLVDFEDEDEGIKFFKRILNLYFGKENEIDDKVRRKIQTMGNAPFEGSREWDVLFRKFREEELRRINHGG